MRNRWFLNFFPIVIVVLLGLIGTLSFFHAGYFPSHDGEWMVIRFSDFHRSLVDGGWPVRWAGRLNFGFGYPVFNFLYPGTFYLTEIFHLLRLNFVDSVKATFVLSYLVSGLFMYLFGKEIFGKRGGLVVAILYLFTPYRFVDMYVRGSLGESVAFMFAPLIFLAVTKLFTETSKRKLLWIGIGALATLGLITAHNVIAYLFLPLIVIYALFEYFPRKTRTKNFLLFTFYSLLLGIAASSFFWLPALWDRQYTIFDQVVIADFTKNFPILKELILPSWGFGSSRPGAVDSMSFQIGVVNLFMIAISLIIIFFDKKRNKEVIFFLTVAFLAIFLMTAYSDRLWRLIPGLDLIQFPWRILSITTFASAFLAGYVATKSRKMIVVILIILATVLLNFSYTRPLQFVDRSDGYYATNDDTTTVQNEYLPKWAKELPKQRAAEKIEIQEGVGKIENSKFKSTRVEFNYKGTSALLKINTAYFPGWEAYINGKKSVIKVEKNGTMALAVNEGNNNIQLIFKETPVRKITDIISIITLAIIVMILFSGV